MKVYMLRDEKTNLYYKRRGGLVARDKAAIWTTTHGVNAAKANTDLKVMTFEVVDPAPVVLETANVDG